MASLVNLINIHCLLFTLFYDVALCKLNLLKFNSKDHFDPAIPTRRSITGGFISHWVEFHVVFSRRIIQRIIQEEYFKYSFLNHTKTVGLILFDTIVQM